MIVFNIIIHQISTNGLISFGSPFSSGQIEPFPQFTPLIEPFWADLEVREENGGAIFYRIDQNLLTLNSITSEVSALNADFSSFSPSYAVIITWFNANLKDNSGILVKENLLYLYCYHVARNIMIQIQRCH